MQTKNPVGRPRMADKARNRSMSLNDAEYAQFKKAGGIKWLKALLAKLIAQAEAIKNDDDWAI